MMDYIYKCSFKNISIPACNLHYSTNFGGGGVNMDADVDKLWNVKASKEQKFEKQKQNWRKKGQRKPHRW